MKYTKKQTQEIAGYIDLYIELERTATELGILNGMSKDYPNLDHEHNQELINRAIILRRHLYRINEEVPAEIREEIEAGRTISSLESLATNTLLGN